MKRSLLILLLFIIWGNFSPLAASHDFEFEGLFYRITSVEGKTVAVCPSPQNNYSGAIIIPETVAYNGVSYTVTEILNAFNGCKDIYSVETPSTLQRIGPSSFQNSGIVSLTLSEGVKLICKDAIVGCSRLSKLIFLGDFPSMERNTNDLTTGGNALRITRGDYEYLNSRFKVNGITYVPISPSERTCEVIDMDYGSHETTITIPEKVNYMGVEFTVLNINKRAFAYAPYCTEVNICCKGVVGEESFNYADQLRRVNIDGEITEIEKKSFFYCTQLEQVRLPETMKIINTFAFYNTALSSINLPPRLYKICENAFSRTKLQSISIPPSVCNVAKEAFCNCESLTEVIFEDGYRDISVGWSFDNSPVKNLYIGREIRSLNFYGHKTLESVTVSDNTEYLPPSSFKNCTALKEVIIGDRVKEINKETFSGCQALTNVKIGHGIKKIYFRAFSTCKALDKIEIKGSLEEIEQYAFEGCSSLSTLYIESQEPPKCVSYSLNDINKWSCKIYAPNNSIESYRAADQWKDFFFYEPIYNNGTLLNIVSGFNKTTVIISGYTEITFPDGHIALSGNNGPIWEFDDFDYFSFAKLYDTEQSGINDIDNDNKESTILINFIGEVLNVSGAVQNEYVLYDINGRVLTISAGNSKIDMSGYPVGAYILKAGNHSVKFIKR